ncbi:hypothetical protein AAG906_022025 [Vitis piasezkii]
MRLAKKLLGAKKAWKSLTSRVQSKRHKLNISKAKNTHLVACKRPRKRRAFKRSYSALHYDHHYKRCDQQQLHKGFAAIYVDHLFAEGAPGETSKGKQVVAEGSNGGKAKTETGAGSLETKASEKSGCTVSDAWKAAVASSPQLRGVDERADEFISTFHKNEA